MNPNALSDLRGLSRLGFDAAAGIAELVESMHHTIASGASIVGTAPQGTTRGITGFVYRTVRGSIRLAGFGTDAVLGLVERAQPRDTQAPERGPMLAAVNGLWGDHLAASGNPLAITMSLRHANALMDPSRAALARQIAIPRPRVLVLVHGLCMSDRQWTRDGHNHGIALAEALDMTPIFVSYNSGRHISENGSDLSRLLDSMVANWPVPIEELVIVGHSMGGLVARSACHDAQSHARGWLRSLSKLVFLGTPHHGAALERAGRLVDAALQISPYVAPFARLGKVRSAGITDLRYGNVQHADWIGRDRHAQRRDDRVATPLPGSVAGYALAATTSTATQRRRVRLPGDGLVSVASALGEHRMHALDLSLPPDRKRIVAGCGHLELLSRDEVYRQLRDWIGSRSPVC